MTVLVQDGEENPDVLHSSVHALTIEGYHGMGGVANDDARRTIVIRLALETNKW